MSTRYDFRLDRYMECTCAVVESDDGEYVRYEDYAELQAQVAELMPYVGHQVDCSFSLCPDTQGCDCGYLELAAIKGGGDGA